MIRIRHVYLFLLFAIGILPFAFGQTTAETVLLSQQKKVFPTATSFSPKQATPVPHYVAYAGTGDAKTVAGYVFWTTELEPLERGYDGPIKMLVGMDTKGVLTGVLVVEHHEPYGYFSVELPAFANQFKGKSISDKFEPGADVDAVSRASISIKSSSRAIRNGARRVARALLTPPAPAK
jgi:NosR/NirI family transcriptional regulator, nitrous oxide reductase regulator